MEYNQRQTHLTSGRAENHQLDHNVGGLLQINRKRLFNRLQALTDRGKAEDCVAVEKRGDKSQSTRQVTMSKHILEEKLNNKPMQ